MAQNKEHVLALKKDTNKCGGDLVEKGLVGNFQPKKNW